MARAERSAYADAMKWMLLLGGFAATSVFGQLYKMEVILQGDTLERFGSPFWTSGQFLGTYLVLEYDLRLAPQPAPPGSVATTYLTNGPHNFWQLSVGDEQLVGPIPSLQVSDTGMSLHFSDASTGTVLDMNLVYRFPPPPGRLLPGTPGSSVDFAEQFLPPADPNLPMSSFAFRTDGGFGLASGGFRSEVYEARYLTEEYPFPPPVVGPVPEPVAFAGWGAALLFGVLALRLRPNRPYDRVRRKLSGHAVREARVLTS